MSDPLFDISLERITLTGRAASDKGGIGTFNSQILSPTWVLKRAPDELAELMAEYLDGKTIGGRRRISRLQTRTRSAVLVDPDGRLTLGGQTCCFELMDAVAGRMHNLPIPSDHLCSCGCVWSLEYRMRERGARHA